MVVIREAPLWAYYIKICISKFQMFDNKFSLNILYMVSEQVLKPFQNPNVHQTLVIMGSKRLV